MNELVVLPPEVNELALKISEKKQKEIQLVLTQIFEGTSDWEKQVDAIEVKDINDTMSIQLADVARKNAKNARVAAEKVFDSKREEVQAEMSEYKLEDSLWLKSKQIMQLKFKHIEEKAKYKADFAKRYEAEQLELRTKERLLKVIKYNDQLTESDVINLSDEAFKYYLSGLEKIHNDLIEEKRKAEELRIAAEKAEQARIKKIEEDNKRLEAEAKKKAELHKKRSAELLPYAQYIRDYNTLINKNEADYQAELKDIDKGAKEHLALKAEEEEKAKAEKELQDKLLAKIEADNKKIAIEAEKLRIAKELQDKKLAEERAKKEEIELAPDKDKLQKLANDLLSFDLPDLKSDEAKNVLIDVKSLLNKISNHIESKLETLNKVM